MLTSAGSARFSFLLLAGCAAAVLASAPAASASECFAPPPSAVGGDVHAAVEPTVLDTSQHRLLEGLLDRLEGRWRGTAKGYLCEGRTGAPRERRDDHDVNVSIEVANDGRLSLRAELVSPTRGTSRIETLRLFLRDDRLRNERDDPAGDVKILDLGADRVAYLHKTGLAGSGNFVELSRRITVSGRSLRISNRVYSQGGLSAASEWTLTRR